jgi:hypothetical protein
LEGLIDEEEDLIFETKPELFSIGTITILDEIVSLLSVKVSKIRTNGKSKPQQRILDKSKVEVVASIT